MQHPAESELWHFDVPCMHSAVEMPAGYATSKERTLAATLLKFLCTAGGAMQCGDRRTCPTRESMGAVGRSGINTQGTPIVHRWRTVRQLFSVLVPVYAGSLCSTHSSTVICGGMSCLFMLWLQQVYFAAACNLVRATVQFFSLADALWCSSCHG